ncbi:MAG: hypothetical protein ABL949_10425 [Fimbriimonadaceae bacterium]
MNSQLFFIDSNRGLCRLEGSGVHGQVGPTQRPQGRMGVVNGRIVLAAFGGVNEFDTKTTKGKHTPLPLSSFQTPWGCSRDGQYLVYTNGKGKSRIFYRKGAKWSKFRDINFEPFPMGLETRRPGGCYAIGFSAGRPRLVRITREGLRGSWPKDFSRGLVKDFLVRSDSTWLLAYETEEGTKILHIDEAGTRALGTVILQGFTGVRIAENGNGHIAVLSPWGHFAIVALNGRRSASGTLTLKTALELDSDRYRRAVLCWQSRTSLLVMSPSGFGSLSALGKSSDWRKF